MDINGIGNSTAFVVACICLLIFGIAYNYVVERFQKRTLRFTAELVVGGVLVTLLASGFFIGWNSVVKVLILFVASGLPMIIGSWNRAARDDEEAKKIASESVNHNRNGK